MSSTLHGRKAPRRGAETGPGPLLRRALRREVALPALLALGGLSVTFLTKSLLVYADWIVNRGLSGTLVGWIALLEIVPVLSQTLPFAILIGVLVALGRLQADLELLAMESLGIGRLQLVPAVAGVAAVGWLLAGGLSLFAAPASRAALEHSLEKIQRERPAALIRAGIATRFEGRQLLAREVSADGRAIEGVLLWLPDLGEAVFGERGEVRRSTGDPSAVELALEEATVLGSPTGKAGGQLVEVAHFETHLVLSPPEELPGDRVASQPTLALARPATGLAPELLRRRRAELHRRFAQPTAALLLGLVAAPLALGRRRFSRSSGAVAGLLLTVGYYGLGQLGEALVADSPLPVEVGVWLAPAAVVVLLVVLLARLGHFRFEERPDRRRASRAQRASRPVGVRRVLDRYVLALFAGAAGLACVGLFAGYFLIDILERLDWFAHYRASVPEIAIFYAARSPLLASRVVPMGMLVGATLTVSLLAARNELVALQACGIRLGRALLPVLVSSALVVPVYFWVTDAWVTRSNAWADRIKVERIKDRATGSSTEAWYRAEGQLVRASRSGLRGGRVEDLVLYELAADGLPTARIHAREARRLGDASAGEEAVWELEDAQAILISEHGLRVVPAPRRYVVSAARRAEVDPMHLPVSRLVREIRGAQRAGYPALTLQVELHRKLAGPLACLLLPALALLVAVRSRRAPSPARNLLAGAALGVAYLLIGDVAASLGYGGTLSPVAAGWAPPTLALFGVGALLLRPRS